MILLFNYYYLIDIFLSLFVTISNISDDNPYWGAWRGGIQQGLINPFKGVGPSGTRNTCANLDTNLPKWLPGKNYCGNHPHNFYIQLFAEVGVFGLLICFEAKTIGTDNFETSPISSLGLNFPSPNWRFLVLL